MSMNELDSKVKELRELRRMAEEIQTEIDGIQDSIKAEMAVQGVDTISGTDWKITWKDVITSRPDGKALRKSLPDVADLFTSTTKSRRFVVA